MSLTVKTIKNVIIPKGNGVAKNYKYNANAEKIANYSSLFSAIGGVSALIANETEIAGGFLGLTVSNMFIADYFKKKASILSKEFTKIFERFKNIKAIKN